MDGWYLYDGGQQQGPFNEATVRELFAARRLPAGTLAWYPGAQEWELVAGAMDRHHASLPPPPPPPGVAKTWSAASTSTGHVRGQHVSAAHASLGRRLSGVVLDVLIPWGLAFAAAMIGIAFEWVLGPELGGFLGGILVLGVLITTIVWQILGLGRLGHTYGKHLAGVRVVSIADGRPIGGGTAIVRNIIQSLGLYPLGLGWFWALWDPEQQTWHDKVVNSVVLDATDTPRADPYSHLVAAFRGSPL